MRITLYTNNSENNRMDKDLTQIGTYGTSYFKDITSLIDPVILLTGNVKTIGNNCNYMYLPEFEKYYFINSIKSVRNGMFEISGHIDVLSTYKTQIRENKAIIKKQENDWNLYLNDGSLKVYQNPYILTKPFPSGFNTLSFVLAVAGG